MKKNSANFGAEGLALGADADELVGPFSNSDDRWMDLLRAAERPRPNGRLGGYEVLSEVRRGGQGLVFRARQPGTGRVIALKRLAAGAFSTAAEQRRFEREVEVAAGLTHPGIVTVHGVEEIDGVSMLAMEWVDGRPLAEWAREQPAGADGLRRKLGMFLSICAAVQHAHQHGVIHRDLKPSNILIDTDGRCRVLDFGLARRLNDAGDEANPDATRTLGFIGTPAYAAPEHFTEDAAPLDVRSDVYSLGVVLYELLTGRRPFDAQGLRELLDEIAERQPPRPSSLADGIALELDTIVAKAIAKHPEQRYQSVHALSEDIERHLSGQPVLAMPPSAGYLLAKWIRRHRVVFTLSALLVVSLTASVAVGAWQTKRIADERDRAGSESRRAKEALARVEEEKARVVEARDELERALTRAELKAYESRRVQNFYLDSLFTRDALREGEGAVTAFELILRAADLVEPFFADQPMIAVEIMAQIARTLVLAEHHEEGRRLASRARELHSRDPDAAFNTQGMLVQTTGEAETGLGHEDEARERLHEALEIYTSHGYPPVTRGTYASALGSLGHLELSAENYAEAERAFEEAIFINDGVEDELRRGSFLAAKCNLVLGTALAAFYLGRAEEAEETAFAVLDEARGIVSPENAAIAALVDFLARVNLALADYEHVVQIEDDYVRALQGGSGRARDEAALLGLSWSQGLQRSGEPVQAEVVLRRALELDPGPAVRAQLRRAIARTLTDQRDYEASVEEGTRAVELCLEHLDPGDAIRAEVLIEHLRMLLVTGRVGEARELLPLVHAEVERTTRLGHPPRPEHLGGLAELEAQLAE